MTRLWSTLISIACCAVIGCGPTVKKGPNFPTQQIRRVALLPVQSDGAVQRERLDYLYAVLRTELEGSGFVLVDEELVKGVCADPQCTNRDRLFSQYKVDALLSLTVDSLRQANLLVGNYQSLGGTLSFLGPQNELLASVSHSESERGGLIFNTGQVIQGLKTTIGSFSDDRFAGLGQQFVKKLVLALPNEARSSAPAANSTDEPLQIESVQITAAGDAARYRICALATPGAAASVALGTTLYDLPEVTPGNYCSVFLLGWLLQDGAEKGRVVIRSPYGAVREAPLMARTDGICDPQKAVRYEGRSFTRLCSAAQCTGDLGACRSARLVLFGAPSSAGPFTRRGEISSKGFWRDTAKSPDSSVYALIALSSDGAASMPRLFDAGPSTAKGE